MQGTKRKFPIDPSLKPLLSRLESGFDIDLESLPATEARRLMNATVEVLRPPRPAGIETRDLNLELAGGREIGLRLYRPREAREKRLPGLIYLHGGGWVSGNLDTHDALAAALAVAADIAVVSVDYRLAPEHPFPAPLRDCFDALEGIARDAAGLGLDRHRLAIGGDSAGANLAAAVALIARERKGPLLAFQLLLYPALDIDFDRPSYLENAEAPLLSREMMRWFWRQYLGAPLEEATPLAAPLKASDLTGLPPTYLLTIDNDPLRDEGELYGRRLAAAGIPVQQRRAPQLFHGCLRLAGLSARVNAEIALAAQALTAGLARSTG